MEIVAIFPPYIYSIQHDGRLENEYDRLLDEWNDVSHVVQFMEENSAYLDADIWNNVRQPEDAAAQVLDEAARLEELFEQLHENVTKGETPDFDSHFHPSSIQKHQKHLDHCTIQYLLNLLYILLNFVQHNEVHHKKKL